LGIHNKRLNVASRRTALLCACAVAALAAAPALAAPADGLPRNFSGEFASGPIRPMIKDGDIRSLPVASGLPAGAPPGGAGAASIDTSAVKADSGSFDVEAAAPSAVAKSEEAAGRVAARLAGELAPARPFGPQQVEQMLVTDVAARIATRAQVENGAIVLSSSAATTSATKVPLGAAGNPVGDNGNGNGSGGSTTTFGEDDSDVQPRIVKTKSFQIKPMTPEEATLQMSLLGHDFFFFTNAETERAAVVYRRDDGDVGLIDQA